MTEDDDLYAILGVSRTASEDEIRKAYRKLARKHHPDLNPDDPAAEERFKRVSGAYEVLNKPEKRALYDELGKDAEKIGYDPEKAEEYRQWRRRAEAAASYGGGAGFGGGFGGFGGQGAEGHVDLEDLFGDLFARGQGGGGRASRRQRGPQRGRDAEARFTVPFLDAARGTTASVEVPKTAADGSVEIKRLSLTIPAGVETGQKLRLAGQGQPGTQGAPAGDLLVTIEVQDHPVWGREGNDLTLTLPITVSEALRGGQVDVPTLAGSVKLKVPSRAQSGQRMRLKGKGIAPAKGAAGDLYVTLEVVTPTGGDDATREELAAAIDALYDRDVRAELLTRVRR
jgi:DnaJ-class molecular chaperone